jgi:hypothetical protein
MRLVALTFFTCLSLPTLGSAAAGSDKPAIVQNFALLDQQGSFHELDYLCKSPGVKAIALFIQGNDCPLVQKRVPELKRLRQIYQPQGVRFVMLNANLQDSRADIVEEAAEFDIDFPILKDSSQVIAKMLDITRTAEMLLIRAVDCSLIYRGAIDDRLSYQTEKPEASEHYFLDAVDAFLKGKPIAKTKTAAPGCKVTLDLPDQVSYTIEVAPILKARCVSCHTKGGIGPFAMANHRKVKGWSEMMEEVILTRQMPPWHADSEIGHFANDAGLTDDETKTLISWIRQGAPRGGGADPLEGYVPESVEWTLGTPDHVFALPEQTVAAEGVFDYRHVTLESPFDKEVWLRGIEVNPGNTRVLHHVVVWGAPKGGKGRRGKREKFFTGYAPGSGTFPAPDGIGVRMPKGYILDFELHYTASGRPEVDNTEIGFFLAKGDVKQELHTGVVVHPRFEIPPHAQEYPEQYSRKINTDIVLYAMNPHMHFRGKRMSFHAKLPDGTMRDLLSVPDYNFNWQRTYILQEPINLPKGSEIVIKNAWDNSSLNPHNPDPSRKVRWGEQTFEEMFFATYQFVVAK